MLKIYSYNIPFKVPFSTSGNTLKNRQGIVVTLSDGDITAYGEIAPLPGFSKYSLSEILSILELNKKDLESAILNNEFDLFSYVLYQIHDIPSLKFGLDTLANDFYSKKRGISLSEHLFDGQFIENIESNAVIGIDSIDSSIKKAQGLYDEGFKTFKLKVGVNFSEELELIKKLRATFPDIKIRIDANEAWSYKEAFQNLGKCADLNIEYCEEPLKSTENDRLSDLFKQVKINFASDENFRNKKDAEQLIEQNVVNVFILKPMMFGSFSEIYVTKKLVESHYSSIVFTTSLESKIGRTVTAILASVWGAKEKAHGLSTGSLLKFDLGSDQEIISGSFHIPKKLGIGIDLNYNHLKEIIT